MKKKRIMIFVSIIVCSVSFLLAYFISNYQDKNCEPKKIFDVVDDKGEGLTSELIYQAPKKLVFSNPSNLSNTAEKGITIQAVTEPEDSSYVKLEWSAYFLNQTSSYALDHHIEDFLSIEVNRNQCTIVCLAPFCESIIIRCKALYQPTIFAECQIDYEKRIIKRNLEFSKGNWIEDDGVYYIDFADDTIYQFANNNAQNTIYGDGSVEGIKTNRYYYTISKELESYLLTQTELYDHTTYAKRTEISEFDLSEFKLFNTIGAEPENIDLFMELMYEAIPNFIMHYPDSPLFIIDLECSGLSVTQTFTYSIGALSWKYSPKINNITFNLDTYIF